LAAQADEYRLPSAYRGHRAALCYYYTIAAAQEGALAEAQNSIPYSYRQNPAVPAFPDDKPVFVFDGVCVLCSGGAGWLMRHDRGRHFRLATAQSRLGAALYAHYLIDGNETYLLVSGGLPYTKSDGYLQMCRAVGGWWRPFLLLRLVPRRLRDWGYDVIARNRYRWFGKVAYCQLLTEEMRAMLLDAPGPESDASPAA
jgi:predicted DCC family thiol-disulfide oxidoreductase YuxK